MARNKCGRGRARPRHDSGEGAGKDGGARDGGGAVSGAGGSGSSRWSFVWLLVMAGVLAAVATPLFVPLHKPNKLALLISAKDLMLNTRSDSEAFSGLLQDVYGFKVKNIYRLHGPSSEEARAAMIRFMARVQRGDLVVFHFSGHGVQDKEHYSALELDGHDEHIQPMELLCGRLDTVVDNELNRILVGMLPKQAALRAFFDNCHSGTALDLKYSNTGDGWRYSTSEGDVASDEKDVISVSASLDHERAPAFVNSSAQEEAQRRGPGYESLAQDLVGRGVFTYKLDSFLRVKKLSYNEMLSKMWHYSPYQRWMPSTVVVGSNKLFPLDQRLLLQN